MRPQNLFHQSLATQKCTLGCPILDRCLGGGIPCNSITELVAESGSGKTQLCLQLSLSAQLPASSGGLSASSLYLHTEFPFPIRRLHELSTNFRSSNPCNDHNPCDNIFVQGVYTVDHLLDLMPRMESFIENSKSRFPIRLIVIDSIAALFRSDFENTPGDLKKRSSLFFKISGKLKAMATGFGWRRVCPALGLAWANCVNSRLFLARDDEFVSQENQLVNGDGGDFVSRRTRRWIHVVFAPHLPISSCEFEIRREGGEELSQSNVWLCIGKMLGETIVFSSAVQE
ncbi:hypothetical protein JRO89_XS04G0279200 [Xanthoceras sorbifolium]|uniref:RecA family profile 1 domain-containing protein n=1 Tax=Xanthoceras sorbifolium TaxID=99658 RepID=A0ABQ8I7I3_9ROSI|nr:hypothetical protein JRO89_XS04G0279200 [Xanthoceras sorbifolium]